MEACLELIDESEQQTLAIGIPSCRNTSQQRKLDMAMEENRCGLASLT